MERAAWIATQARRFRQLHKLARRSVNARGPEEAPFQAHPLDVLLTLGADETEWLCAEAVEAISAKEPRADELLDRLSVLPDDYLLAIYFAVGEYRKPEVRDIMESRPEFQRALDRMPQGIEDWRHELERMARPFTWPGTPIAPDSDPPYAWLAFPRGEERADYQRFVVNALRQKFGLDHALTEADEALLDEAEVVAQLALIAEGRS